MRPVAHTPREQGGTWHDLATHLSATATLARERAEKFGAGELAYLAGLIHDVGKYNPAFQQYLLDANAGREATSVPHAVYGAMLAFEEGASGLAWPVYGHHAGMPSRVRLQEAFADPEISKTYGRVKAAAEASGWEFEPERVPEQPSIDLHGEMLLRMIFSALVDADFLDTEAHFDPERGAARTQPTKPSVLLPMLLESQERIALGATGPVNEVRREVYEDSLLAANLEAGVFRLSAPTGAGKTRTALAFGLSHAVRHGMDRVIFAVPYITITDQTAAVVRSIFGEQNVIEHHSGVLAREPSWRNRLAVQNWDAPLVITTTVQLLESLLSNRPSRCRKLHNITNSVIVLDEAQTLPVRMLQPIVDVLRELTDRYGCTVVLSTATQPALEASSRYLEGFEDVRDIVPPERAREHFQKLRRVRYEVEREVWTWERVATELRNEDRAMAVVNTRKDAQQLHEVVGEAALHLSAAMCQAHRIDVLREVRRRLAVGEGCLLVSTQVVEAGVDLDFDTVLRAFGPLDSVVQAAGRCNREGRLQAGRVVVFRPEAGTLPPGEYQTGTYQARNILRRGADLHDPAIFRSYFTRLYQGVGTDAAGIQDLRAQFDYPTVAAEFRIIEDARFADVIIEYDDEARALIDRIKEEGELRPGDLRKLQRYVVGLSRRDFEREQANTEEIVEGVFVWRGPYDDVRGLELREETT